MTDEELKTKLAFSMFKNLNTTLADQLLGKIGEEESLFKMTESQLSAISLLPPQTISDDVRSELQRRASKELNFIIANGIEALYYRDNDYPSRLLNCEDAPVMLYKLGECDLEAKHVVSIVGTRHATPYGIEMTNRIVKELAQSLDDLVIVSGLAYGIDVAAHRAAIDNGVPTVAVTAVPLNTIYPADHRDVAVRMLRQGGALITEYSTSHEVHKTNFVARNRIVAGMSDLTIVVESDAKGGSLITAGLALEYNREVFAVPGRLTDRYSRGTIDLIASNKAHIFTSTDELIAEMGWTSKQDSQTQLSLEFELSEREQKVYDFLVANPGSRINEIMIGTSLPQPQVKDILFNLEMRDVILSMAGGKYAPL